jgi:putative hemolysin
VDASVTVIATIVAIVVVVASVLVTGYTAAADAALQRLPRGRSKRLVEAGARGSTALDALVEREGRALAGAAIIAGASYVASAAAIAWMLIVLYPTVLYTGADVLIAAVAALVIIFSLGEALPRAIALANPEGTALAVAGPARRLTAAMYPLAQLLSIPWTSIVGVTRGEQMPRAPWSTEREEGPAGDDAEAEAEAEAEEALVDAFVAFREKVVREVMVPRPDMVALEDTATTTEVLAMIAEHGYSRMPVYHDTLDDIRGVLYAKDLLLALGPDGCSTVKPGQLAREPFWVPETKSVESLLLEMRNRTHIALVADEYGGTAGLVTIEDLLEEIVGDIFDEYDLREQLVVPLGAGRFRVDAKLSVDDLNEQFDTAIDMEADTVGGIVTELAGHIPQVGESVEIEGLRLIVDALEGARVRALIVEPAPRAEEQGADPDEHAHTA